MDWKRKLTSRKLWIAIAGFVSMLIVAFGFAEETATQVAAIIMAGADVLGYMIAEGLADSANGTITTETIVKTEMEVETEAE